MQRRSDDDPGAQLRAAQLAVDLALTDPRQASSLARDVCRRAGAGAEAHAVANRAAGLVAVALGDLPSAVRSLRAAISVADRAGLATRGAEARASLSYVLVLTGATRDALAEVDHAIGVLRGVRGGQVLMQRALILTELGRFDEAEAGFDRSLRALRRAGGDPLVEGDVYTNRSVLHTARRAWRAVDDDLAHAAELYARAGHPGRLALVEHNRGSAAVLQGDLPAAFAHLDEAERRYRAQDRDLGQLPVERAEALLSVRLLAEARASAEQGVATYERQRNEVDLVQARLVLAQVAMADGDAGVARSEADLARRAALRQQRPGWAALAAYVALRARWQSGERGDAILAAGRRTLVALESSGWVVAAADTRLLVARLLLELGRVPSARRLLAGAASDRRRGPAELRARAWHAEALLRLAADDRRGADRALAAGIDVLDRFRASLGATELRAYASGAGAELASLGMTLALASGRAASVLGWAERWRAGALLHRPARPPADAVLAAQLAELRQVVMQAGEAAVAGTDQRALLSRQVALERAVRQRSRHAAGAPAAGAISPTRAALAGALQDATLVEFVAHEGRLHAVVVTARRMALHTLGPVDAITTEINALRFGMRRLAYGIGAPSSLNANEELSTASARAIDHLLIAPLGLGEGPDAPPLVLVPTGELHALPWAALPSCVGRPVSLAPSAALWLRAATAPPRTRVGPPVLVAGPGLHHAVAEVRAVARMHPDALRFSGRRAAVVAVADALEGAGLAHLATHGRFRADNPLFSALELADGPLTVYDLERLRRPPGTVVLSACDSGLPAVHPGDEVLGLAAAMLAMGTRSLVASVVPVPDDATKSLMVALHRRLRRGDAPATALAVAQQETSRTAATRRDRVAAMSFVCLGAG